MSYGVPVDVVERARELVGVHQRSEVGRTCDRGSDRRFNEGWQRQRSTADRRTAIDYLLGHNRTTKEQYLALDSGERRIARAAVLRVLLETQLLNPVTPMQPRIASRLFTDEDRCAGSVTFIDPTTGIERTVPVAIAVAG